MVEHNPSQTNLVTNKSELILIAREGNAFVWFIRIFEDFDAERQITIFSVYVPMSA